MDLYNRLKYIKERKAAAQKSANTAREEDRSATPPAPATPEERQQRDGKTGSAPALRADHPGDSPWQALGEFVWKRTRLIDLHAPDRPVHPSLWPDLAPWENFVFFDTETTGLSSGAGTLIFLFGSGRFTAEGFLITQWFLGDFPGEPLFLSDIMADIAAYIPSGPSTAASEKMPAGAGDTDRRSVAVNAEAAAGRVSGQISEEGTGPAGAPVLVSYNGRSYDAPLFASRLLMNGMMPPEIDHLDLLYPSRRFYAENLENCRLGMVEAEVLGISRDLDIPGREIPDLYFSFQRNHAAELPDADPAMLPVLEHHSSDISSLALLQMHLSAVLHEAESGPSVFDCVARQVSPRGLARQLMVSGSDDAALDILRHGASDRPSLSMLATFLRRRREYTGADEIWTRLYREFGDPLALEQMLIHLEHRCGDYRGALSLLAEFESALQDGDVGNDGRQASASTAVLRRGFRADLNKRRARLQTKLQGTPPS